MILSEQDCERVKKFNQIILDLENLFNFNTISSESVEKIIEKVKELKPEENKKEEPNHNFYNLSNFKIFSETEDGRDFDPYGGRKAGQTSKRVNDKVEYAYKSAKLGH